MADRHLAVDAWIDDFEGLDQALNRGAQPIPAIDRLTGEMTVINHAGLGQTMVLDRGEARIIEVESYPIVMGPVPRVRARIEGWETAWRMASDFEFAIEPDEGFQRQVR